MFYKLGKLDGVRTAFGEVSAFNMEPRFSCYDVEESTMPFCPHGTSGNPSSWI